MGCWIGALGRLTISPEPDNNLIKGFVYFSEHTCPDSYRKDEIFMNTWFFDSENRLVSGIGKFAEPSIWYEHLKEYFFKPRGYQLIGDPQIVGEFDLDIWKLGEERYREKQLFQQRVKELMEEEGINKYSGDTKNVKKMLLIPIWLANEAEARNLNLSKVLRETLQERLHMI